MRDVIKTTTIKFTCDYCSKNFENGWLTIEETNDLWLMLFEKYKDWYKNYASRHIAGRKVLDFCSNECLSDYIDSRKKAFIWQIAGVKTPDRVNAYFTK